jgi:hypothetical protein
MAVVVELMCDVLMCGDWTLREMGVETRLELRDSSSRDGICALNCQSTRGAASDRSDGPGVAMVTTVGEHVRHIPLILAARWAQTEHWSQPYDRAIVHPPATF